MPSIKAWNGGGWVNPEWYLGSKGWVPFRPAYGGVQPYWWDHSSDQGWVQSNGSGGWVPATSTGAEMRMSQPGTYAPYALTHQLGPLTYPGAPIEGIQFAAQVRGEVWLAPYPLFVYVSIEYPNLNRSSLGSFQFQGSFGHTWVKSGVLSNRNPEPPVLQVWWSAQDVTNVPECGAHVYVDNSEVQDSAGNRLTVGADAGFQPKYWDGASWVVQNN